jgi:hypothetical protein
MPIRAAQLRVVFQKALALGVALWSLAVAGAPPSRFYFVQITDTHWGARDGVALTRRAAEAINALPQKIEFVVHTGDLFADAIGDPELVQEAPVFYLPGNHDILQTDVAATAALYRRHFGGVSSRTEVQGVVCLFFYSEPLIGGFSAPDYDPLAWLTDQFKQAGGSPVILFQHAPSVGAFLDSGDESEPDPDTHRAWAALVRRYPALCGIIAGHIHRDELHWFGNVPVYVGSSVARFWDRQPSFRVYDYWGGKLGYTTVYLQGGGRKPAAQTRTSPPKKDARFGKE